MNLGRQIGPEFQAFELTHDRSTYEVFRGGSGPAVLVLHEIPGLHAGVIDFARRLIAAGYTVYLPSLYGRPGAPANGRESLRSIVQICVAREFTKLANRTSPIVGWLRALAASAYRECGGPGVGVVGMCFTGGFALATALEPSVVAWLRGLVVREEVQHLIQLRAVRTGIQDRPADDVAQDPLVVLVQLVDVLEAPGDLISELEVGLVDVDLRVVDDCGGARLLCDRCGCVAVHAISSRVGPT